MNECLLDRLAMAVAALLLQSHGRHHSLDLDCGGETRETTPGTLVAAGAGVDSGPHTSKSLTRPRVTTLRGGRRVVRGVTAPTPRTFRRGPAGSFQVQAARAAIDDGCEINTTTPGRETQQ